MAKKLKVSKNLFFSGFVDNTEVPIFLSKSKIFVDTWYPPKYRRGHTYGVCVHEAMASGIPTILAERPEISSEWYFGETFKKANPKDLANKILKLLENQKIRNKIIKKNRKIVENKFNFNKNMEKIERVIKSFVN